MNELRRIVTGEMDEYDLHLQETIGMLTMMQNAVEDTPSDIVLDAIGHVRTTIQNLRAELDDIRGALLRMTMAEGNAS